MADNMNRSDNWKTEGEAPDYRFSLANERTYLAWIRTSLALLAGAIGIDQLTPNLASLDIRIAISAFLCICSASLAAFAFIRWAKNEKAMRHNDPLSYTGFLKIISIMIGVVAAVFIIVVAS